MRPVPDGPSLALAVPERPAPAGPAAPADEATAKPPRHRVWPRITALALVVAVAVTVAATDALHDPLVRLLALTERVIAANPLLGAVLFVLFAALSGVLAFFSSAVLVPVAVYAWGVPLSAALLWLGWLLGGACTYAIGRWLGRPVAGLVAPHKLARYEHKITRETPLRLVALFQLATPSEVPGYLLGMLHYNFLRYIAVVAVGELPYAIGTVLLGESFIKRQVLPFVLLGLAAALFGGWAYARLHRRLDGSAAARGAGDPKPARATTDRG